VNNSIIEKLEKSIDSDNKTKSSHWKKYLHSNVDYKNPFEFLGFGSYSNKTLLTSFFHYIFSILIFGNNIFKSETYKKYKFIFDKSNRQINVDTIRHIFTFDMLKSISPPSNVCIIGDGKCNFLIGNLLTFPKSRIFSINLSQTLINDYLIIKESKILNDSEIQVIESEHDEILKGKKLILIPSHLKKYLVNKDIDLFVNIASFQEMTMDEIRNYFRIIKSNNSLFYCCNREYKKLLGGEELYFDNYPWGNNKKEFNEDCPWHQKTYQKKYPFIRKYDGNTKHCLIDFSL
tara:strand:+ start:633 stop:1502 length:870 start_codon:yes stop_codon:yes gene_type:complete